MATKHEKKFIHKKWFIPLVFVVAFSLGSFITNRLDYYTFNTFKNNFYITQILTSYRFHRDYLNKFLIRDDKEMRAALQNSIEYNLNNLLGNLQDCIDIEELRCSSGTIHESKNAIKTISELRVKLKNIDTR